jgi:ABC-2 type transport system ATP-binding protein
VTAVVTLTALEKRFGETEAVAGLSFNVARGELFGIVGPDGAGKTTTLRMLAGVLAPDAGDAEVRGVSVARDPEGVKAHIAYMSQRFGLYADLTVAENIAFYADLYRVPRSARPERLERLYAFSNLGPFRHRLAGQLSGGMKQKLSLCCALIHEPEVLLLDEPTFGVDPISRRDLWLIVHEMVGRGVTAVVTTSYMDEAERCDRVALLNHGRLVGLAPPADLQGELAGQVLAVRCAPARRAVELLRAMPEVRNAALFGDVLHVNTPGGLEAWPALAARLAANGVTASGEEPIAPSLEDVFLVRTTDG